MPQFGPQTISENGDNGWQDAGTWAAGLIITGDNGSDLNAGWRWQNVTVPAAAIISSATLHIRARNAVTGTITNVHTKYYAHKGDAVQWAEGVFEPTSMTATTAATDWDPSAWVVDDYYDIDLTSVIQEVVNGDWASGYDLAVASIDDGSTANNHVRMYAQGDGDSAANTITIVYTTGGARPIRLTLLGVGT